MSETKSVPRRANVRDHGTGTEVQVQSKPTQITIGRGPDKGCQVSLTPCVITGEDSRTGKRETVFRWRVECVFHGTMLRARDRRAADSLVRSIGTWCEDCRAQREEERE